MNKELENILFARQINPTAMRILVLDFLLKQTSAISLSDLENDLKNADRITLYRTLKTFEEKGLVHNIKDGSEAAKYALCEADCREGVHHDMHVHFYCTDCKELFCLPKLKLPEVNLPGKFQLSEISLVARGICDKCNKECN
ncbi:MAG: transcriptional repressor [Ferruginibacter sp.]